MNAEVLKYLYRGFYCFQSGGRFYLGCFENLLFVVNQELGGELYPNGLLSNKVRNECARYFAN